MLTFHKIIAGCEEGQEETWRAFLADYTPVVLRLEAVYMPDLSDPPGFWRESLAELSAGSFQRLRAFPHQSEREFLLDLRDFLFARGPASLDPAKDFTGMPEPTVESVSELVRGLPFMHQEVVFLKLAGYSDSTLEQIFRITPAVAARSLERLKEDYAAVLGKTDDKGLGPAGWLRLHNELRAARKEESCTPVRQLVRIQDGQLGWYDKDPVEKHLAECLSCLECWTALREISYWRRAAPPVQAAAIDELLPALPIAGRAAKPNKPKSFIQRLRG